MSRVFRVDPPMPIRPCGRLPSIAEAREEGRRLGLGNNVEDPAASFDEIAAELGISKQLCQVTLQQALFKALVILTERGLSFAALNPQGAGSPSVLHLPVRT